MIKKRSKTVRFVASMRGRLLLALFLSVAVSVGIYFFCHTTALGYIDTVYSSEENKRSREREYIRDLQSYINENDMSSEDMSKISAWAQKNRYVYLIMYRNDELFYTSDDKIDPPDTEEPGIDEAPSDEGENNGEAEEDGASDSNDSEKPEQEKPGGVTVSYPTREELFEYARQNALYPIELADGTVFASVAEYTDYLYRDVANIASFLVAALAVIIIMMLYMQRVTGRIINLGNAVNRVAEGDIEREIKLGGKDEIARLSENVENMRSTMVENIRKEREAFDSNTSLITSMSHDIRTPLTVLLGYIDLMNTHAEGDEVMQSYLKAAETTAMRLSKLSDDMFSYFLVFGGNEIEINFERYHAETLIWQMLSEHIFLLKERGYSVDLITPECEDFSLAYITTDAQKLVRIFDNIFSNIYKYADASEAVLVKVSLNERRVLIEFANKTSHDKPNVESNGIGLKTCKKLAEMLGVDFVCDNSDERYTVSIALTVSD